MTQVAEPESRKFGINRVQQPSSNKGNEGCRTHLTVHQLTKNLIQFDSINTNSLIIQLLIPFN